jgi:endonuclease-3 related protein
MPRPLVLAPTSRLRRRLLRLYEALHRRYGPQCWWPARSAFEVVIGAILTQKSAWVNVERALGQLRRAGVLRAASLAALPQARLAALIRPAGAFRVKARRVRAVLDHLRARHGGDPRRLLRRPWPELRAELLAIPGIGPETADAIGLYGAGRPVFVVDAYTRRILARHGLMAGDADYATIQGLVQGNLPQDPGLFNEYHALLARVAREHCRARPRCEGCPLRSDLRGRPPRRV